MLVPLALAAAAAALVYKIVTTPPKGTPGNLLPTPKNIPLVEKNAKPIVDKGVTGTPRKNTIKMSAARDNRTYTTSVFPQKDGKQFVIAQLNGTTAWISYYQVGKANPPVRKLSKAFAKGDRDQSGRVVSIMMSDFGVKK